MLNKVKGATMNTKLILGILIIATTILAFAKGKQFKITRRPGNEQQLQFHLHTITYVLDCCNQIEVVGKGLALEQAPGNIFSIYTKQEGLVNGKVHYLAQDVGRVLEYACQTWKIAYQRDSPCKSAGYTENVNTCPDESGLSWKYYHNRGGNSYSFLDAGDGLEVQCVNMPTKGT